MATRHQSDRVQGHPKNIHAITQITGNTDQKLRFQIHQCAYSSTDSHENSQGWQVP